MHRGFLPLWRKSQDHPFYKEHRIYSKWEAWIDLLFETQHKDEPKQVFIKMQSITQNYGEVLRSVRGWGLRWGWSESKVVRYLKLLKKQHMIECKSEGITTRISILNFSQYDLKRNGERNTTEAQSTQNRRRLNKDNKDNKDNKPPYSPPKGIDLKSNGESWIDAKSWDDFVEFRHGIKKPLSAAAVTRALKLLKENSSDHTKMIDNSIMNNWQGLFELKNKGYKNENTNHSKVLTTEQLKAMNE